MADPTLAEQVQAGRFDPSAPPVAAAPDSPTPPPPQDAPPPAPEPHAPAPAPAHIGADSPAPTPEETVAAQRVADAQRKMHEATTAAKAVQAENTGLRSEIDTLKQTLLSVVSNPEFQLVPTPPAPAPAEGGDPIDQAWNKYTQVPQGDDKAAFSVLMQHAAEMAEQKIQTNLNAQRIQAANRQRGQALGTKIHDTIAATVAQIAPDVPVKLFWSNGVQAERETPRTITDPLERIAWQTERAIALSRADLQAYQPKPTTSPAVEAAAVARSAAPIMASGPQTSGSIGGAATPVVRTMVDQLRSFQSSLMPGSG